MKMRYKGKTGFFQRKLFIHGFTYDVKFLFYDPIKQWSWYRIKNAQIPYTLQGFQDIWEESS